MNIKRNINSYLHEQVNLQRMNKWLTMRSALFPERDCKIAVFLSQKNSQTWHHQWKKCFSSQRSLKHAAHNSSPVLFTPCGRFLAKYLVVLRRWSFSQYCFACQYRQHACDIHDIHHSYILASFSAFLHCPMFALKSLV